MKIKNVLSYFDGISCGMQGLSELNVEVENYYSCEINPNAIKVSQDNFPSIKRLGDLTKIDLNSLPKIDLFIGGSSCQDFSMAGLRNGMISETNEEITNLERYLELKKEGFKFKGESYLFWEYVNTLRLLKPTYFLLENVKMSKKWQQIITDALGVNPILIDSQVHCSTNRKRLYWTNIPQENEVETTEECLQDILTDGYTNREKGLCLLESCSRPLKTPSKIARRYLLFGFWTVIFKDEETFLKLKKDFNSAEVGDVRYLNQEELEKSQCLPQGYTRVVSRDVAAGLIGNAWNVKTIKILFKGLISAKNN
jgi:DNA (cytosine-5)-methyltransferase 3A